MMSIWTSEKHMNVNVCIGDLNATWPSPTPPEGLTASLILDSRKIMRMKPAASAIFSRCQWNWAYLWGQASPSKFCRFPGWSIFFFSGVRFRYYCASPCFLMYLDEICASPSSPSLKPQCYHVLPLSESASALTPPASAGMQAAHLLSTQGRKVDKQELLPEQVGLGWWLELDKAPRAATW